MSIGREGGDQPRLGYHMQNTGWGLAGIKYAAWRRPWMPSDDDDALNATHNMSSLALDGSGYPWMCYYNKGSMFVEHGDSAGWHTDFLEGPCGSRSRR